MEEEQRGRLRHLPGPKNVNIWSRGERAFRYDELEAMSTHQRGHVDISSDFGDPVDPISYAGCDMEEAKLRFHGISPSDRRSINKIIGIDDFRRVIRDCSTSTLYVEVSFDPTSRSPYSPYAITEFCYRLTNTMSETSDTIIPLLFVGEVNMLSQKGRAKPGVPRLLETLICHLKETESIANGQPDPEWANLHARETTKVFRDDIRGLCEYFIGSCAGLIARGKIIFCTIDTIGEYDMLSMYEGSMPYVLERLLDFSRSPDAMGRFKLLITSQRIDKLPSNLKRRNIQTLTVITAGENGLKGKLTDDDHLIRMKRLVQSWALRLEERRDDASVTTGTSRPGSSQNTPQSAVIPYAQHRGYYTSPAPSESRGQSRKHNGLHRDRPR